MFEALKVADLLWKASSVLLPLLLATTTTYSVDHSQHSTTSTSTLLLCEAQDLLQRRPRNLEDDEVTDHALQLLTRAHDLNPNQPGLLQVFQMALERRIEVRGDNLMDRMGLGSILLECEEYGAAANHLQLALRLANHRQQDAGTVANAAAMLFAARAAVCDWEPMQQEGQQLVDWVRTCLEDPLQRFPPVHPYKALLWPCFTIEDASKIAARYAERALASVESPSQAASTTISFSNDIESSQPLKAVWKPSLSNVYDTSIRQLYSPPFTVSKEPGTSKHPRRTLKVGYISPDFTGKHPLAFLMQDVFQFHDSNRFKIHMYSLQEDDGSIEVQKIRQAADQWTSSSSQDIIERIQGDDLDVLIDLCGYTGTSAVATIMAHRLAPIQVGYMGFPGSTGASFVDYLIVDEVVVPPPLRDSYTENLIFMPHCYFINSHKFLMGNNNMQTKMARSDFGLPSAPESFVYCCHSRPEKIDPVTFRAWLRVLQQVPNSVLWLLRSDDTMESNLRMIAQEEFQLSQDRLVFCGKAPRQEHLDRLPLADLFLDTPAYNAHTVGCDCLSVGVPMVSMLRQKSAPKGEVDTDKWPSRVGASLLQSVDLERDLVASTMEDYMDIMIRCATDLEWFEKVRQHLHRNLKNSPLFDTERWVTNLEKGLEEVALCVNQGFMKKDIFVCDRS